jgi:hypothetical protein
MVSHHHRPHLISNYQVLKLLQSKDEVVSSSPSSKSKKRQKMMKKRCHFHHRDWIQQQVYQYLQSTPCTRLLDSDNDGHHRHDEMQTILCRSPTSYHHHHHHHHRHRHRVPVVQSSVVSSHEIVPTEDGTDHSGYDLTPAEAIQIMNFMPAELVEIHLVIDELHTRMEQLSEQEQFLHFIQSYSKQS